MTTSSNIDFWVSYSAQTGGDVITHNYRPSRSSRCAWTKPAAIKLYRMHTHDSNKEEWCSLNI